MHSKDSLAETFSCRKILMLPLTLYASLARPLLENILPYLREKREQAEKQAEIILKFDPKTDDANEVRDRLSLLKGNVTPRRKPLGTYVRASRRQPRAVPAGGVIQSIVRIGNTLPFDPF